MDRFFRLARLASLVVFLATVALPGLTANVAFATPSGPTVSASPAEPMTFATPNGPTAYQREMATTMAALITSGSQIPAELSGLLEHCGPTGERIEFNGQYHRAVTCQWYNEAGQLRWQIFDEVVDIATQKFLFWWPVSRTSGDAIEPTEMVVYEGKLTIFYRDRTPGYWDLRWSRLIPDDAWTWDSVPVPNAREISKINEVVIANGDGNLEVRYNAVGVPGPWRCTSPLLKMSIDRHYIIQKARVDWDLPSEHAAVCPTHLPLVCK